MWKKEKKSNKYMAEKVNEKKSELQSYINGPENLCVSKTYLIEAFIILLFSSKL